MNIDVVVLYGAIASLFGVVTVLAKVAWSERASRVSRCETDNNYYREQVIPAMREITDATRAQNAGLQSLTRVVEEYLRRSDA